MHAYRVAKRRGIAPEIFTCLCEDGPIFYVARDERNDDEPMIVCLSCRVTIRPGDNDYKRMESYL